MFGCQEVKCHPVKYEVDKASGAIFVDRFLHTAMFYPGNYGMPASTEPNDDLAEACAEVLTKPLQT